MAENRELLLSMEFGKEMVALHPDDNVLDWVMSEAKEIAGRDQPEGLDVSLRQCNKITVLIITETMTHDA